MILKDGWAKVPTGWITQERRLRSFLPGNLGGSIAALKLYLVITSLAGTPRNTPGGVNGGIHVSFDALEEFTGLSRAAISPGLMLLDGLIGVERGRGRRPNRYCVVGFPRPGQGGWAKLPSGFLFNNKWISGRSNRARVSLSAMKLLLVLVAFRENRSGESLISYERIQDYTAMTRNDISKGRSELVGTGLVLLYSSRDQMAQRVAGPLQHNRYVLNGLS